MGTSAIWAKIPDMAKFIRIGNKGINLEQISHYEVGDGMGGTMGRGPSVATGHQVALVLYFAHGDKLSILNTKEAQDILQAIHSS